MLTKLILFAIPSAPQQGETSTNTYFAHFLFFPPRSIYCNPPDPKHNVFKSVFLLFFAFSLHSDFSHANFCFFFVSLLSYDAITKIIFSPFSKNFFWCYFRKINNFCAFFFATFFRDTDFYPSMYEFIDFSVDFCRIASVDNSSQCSSIQILKHAFVHLSSTLHGSSRGGESRAINCTRIIVEFLIEITHENYKTAEYAL